MKLLVGLRGDTQNIQFEKSCNDTQDRFTMEYLNQLEVNASMLPNEMSFLQI
jgi:hypothetical protein